MAGSKILVVAAHQDDEAFIVSRMKSHIDKGDFVHILWTTRSTKLSEGYAALRQSEAIRAANLLGICP